MTEQSDKLLTKDQLATYLYFLSVYSIGVGIIYNWAYWSSFNINILEYLGFTDILKTSILPICINVVLCIFTICFNRNLHSISKVFSSKNRTGIVTKIWKAFYDDIPSTLLFILFFIFLEYIGLKNAQYFAYFFLGILISSIADKAVVLHSLIQNNFIRSALLFVLVAQIPQAYDSGKIDAYRILNNKEYLYVISEIHGLINAKDENPLNKLRLIGFADELLFFYEPTNKTLVISKFEDTNPLILKAFKNYSIETTRAQ